MLRYELQIDPHSWACLTLILTFGCFGENSIVKKLDR
jgi:hypothetical protein